MKKFHTISMVLGGVLLLLLIWSIGWVNLWHDLGLLGWGLVPFFLLEGAAAPLYALGWRYCLADSYRELPFFRTLRIYLAGSAISYLTPTAALGGEVTKAALLADAHKGPEAATAVIVGRLAHALAQLVLIISGSLVILRNVHLPTGVWPLMLVASVAIGAGILAFLVLQKYGKLGAAIRWLVDRRLGGRLMARAYTHMNQVDLALKQYYRDHPGRLPVAVFWHMAAMACGILQSWLFLTILARESSFYAAAGVWLLGNWMDMVIFAIPSDIGAMEGARLLTFKALGYSASLGLSYGVVLRLAQIFWAAAGLVLYATLLPAKRKGVGPRDPHLSRKRRQRT